jgi:broad specificity phosphatase PhoE
MEITFIRHAETVGNTQRRWVGQNDSPLTRRGMAQAEALGRRLDGAEVDVVIASDLGRVGETAARAGLEPITDPVWREVDFGSWDGLTREEIVERYPDQLERLRAGEELSLGGGESWPEFEGRVDGAVDALVDRLGEGGRAIVATHGGVVHAVVSGHLGLRDRPPPWPIDRIRNVALTTLRVEAGRRSLSVINDAGHAPSPPYADEPGSVVALIRHGEAVANAAGRWNGLTDEPLTNAGVAQAEALAARYDGATHVYSSGLLRARQTAAVLAERLGLPHTIREALHEMTFGAWENLTPAEIEERFPEDWHEIMVRGRDLPRGGTGETMEGAGKRIAAALAAIVADHPDQQVAAVSHGGAIRGYLCGILDMSFADRRRLDLPANASVSHVRFGPAGPSLIDYNVIPRSGA